jgi:hypothetical protein
MDQAVRQQAARQFIQNTLIHYQEEKKTFTMLHFHLEDRNRHGEDQSTTR